MNRKAAYYFLLTGSLDRLAWLARGSLQKDYGLVLRKLAGLSLVIYGKDQWPRIHRQNATLYGEAVQNHSPDSNSHRLE